MEPEKTPRERAEDLINLLVADWRPTPRHILWAVRIVLGIGVLLGILTLAGQPFGITLWDWIKLLVVPAVIAGGGLWFNRQQRERELETARQQRAQELEIADRRTQDEALQAYLDQMSDMLIPKEGQPSLSDESPPESLRSVARARTLTVLSRLDGERKARVVQFLYEADLITKDRPVLDLGGADLNRASLDRAGLDKAYLRAVQLDGAYLRGANLSEAYLRGADMSRAYLIAADLRGADLRKVSLRGAHLNVANLSRAYLSETYLRDANLNGADLSEADLSGAPLMMGSSLDRANLAGARGWTDKHLERCKSLKDATMPNGQKYEDWIEDRKGRGKDGENASPS